MPRAGLETLLELAQHLGQALDQSEILDGALSLLCDHFSLPTAWITLGRDASEQRLAAHLGLPPALAANDFSALGWGPCSCQRLMSDGDLPTASGALQCDRLELASGDTSGLRQHATALLLAGSDVLGMLHLALPEGRHLSAQERLVLEAAGRTLGAALRAAREPSENGGRAAAMLSLTSRLLALRSVQEVGEETALAVSRALELALTGVLTYESSRREFVLQAGSGWPEGSVGSLRVAFDDAGDPLARAAHSSSPVLLRGAALPEVVRRAGQQAMCAAPMAVGGKLVGLLLAASPQADALGEPELQYLALVAEHVALALDRTQVLTATRRQVRDLAALHDRAAEQTRQLTETYGATLAVLGDALELRDEDTMGHTRRVVGLAVALGRELNLPSEDLTHLEWGAYVHDLGKIGVPDAVLRKPGPLSPDEWHLMQRHPEQGYNLLQRLFFLTRSLDVVRYHHERFDGKGYPLGLRGDEIPLLARIFAVADAYDAMTNDRPYRRAMSVTDALQEIQRNRGSQFDPQVVDTLLRLPKAVRDPVSPPSEPFEDSGSSSAQLPPDGQLLLEFARVAGAVLRAADLPSALDVIVAEIQRRFGYNSCAFLLVEPDAGKMELAAQRGFPSGDALPSHDVDLVVGRVLESQAPYYLNDIDRGASSLRSELALPLSLDGAVFGVLDIASPEPDAFPDSVRSVLEAFAVLASFTVERSRHQSEIERVSLVDETTGLGNLRAVAEAAEREIARAGRHQKPLTLLTLRIDQFADLHRQGRSLSEDALRAVAGLVRETCRKEDVAGRREGGEFLMLLPETAKVGGLLVAERIRADLARLARDSGPLSASIGVVSMPDDGKELQALLEAADQAMYRAVRRGGNEVVAATRRA